MAFLPKVPWHRKNAILARPWLMDKFCRQRAAINSFACLTASSRTAMDFLFTFPDFLILSPLPQQISQ